MAKKAVSSEAVAADRLRAFVQRIERLEEEKAALAADIKEIYAEAKGDGFDTKVLRMELYLDALGEYVETPLGRATMERVGAGAH